jgi:hypothetical protein
MEGSGFVQGRKAEIPQDLSQFIRGGQKNFPAGKPPEGPV